jgi:hypothetical protein
MINKKSHMTIKTFLILLILATSTLSFSQNIKKILTTDELNQFREKGFIIKEIDSLKRNLYDGFCGNLKIEKVGKKVRKRMIDVWVRENYKNSSDAIMAFNSKGYFVWYREYNKQRVVTFDCTYRYETIHNNLYRIERMIIRHESGNDYIVGNRYVKMHTSTKNCGTASRQKKFGKWEYFEEDGSLIKTRQYGEIK